MWHDGKPAPEQCEGCTFFNGQIRELSYLHSRDVTYATFSQGPYEQSARYRDFLGLEMPWYSARDSADALLAGRWFGMQVCYLRDRDRAFETYWTSGRAAEATAPSYGLLNMTVYGRQETWEDSPAGWPQPFVPAGSSSAPTGAPPPSGRAWPRGAPTISASAGAASAADVGGALGGRGHRGPDRGRAPRSLLSHPRSACHGRGPPPPAQPVAAPEPARHPRRATRSFSMIRVDGALFARE